MCLDCMFPVEWSECQDCTLSASGNTTTPLVGKVLPKSWRAYKCFSIIYSKMHWPQGFLQKNLYIKCTTIILN